MMGLNKLGAAVTSVIAITLIALVAEILYVLWRRRRRYRPRARVEPQEPSLPTESPPSSLYNNVQPELQLHQQVMKYECQYGPSRQLFTIKEEEEREGFDSENGECSANIVVKKKKTRVAKTVSFNEVLVIDEVVVKVDELVSETTPFSTPCASPPYYTPLSSPVHETCKDNIGGNG